MACLLKRVLPFALTLLAGLSIGTLTNLSRLNRSRDVPAQVNTSEPQLINSLPHCFSDVENQLIGWTMITGFGSSHHEVIKIAFERQQPEVEKQYSDGIIYYENKLKDAKILSLPSPDYWTEEHDFRH